MKKISPLGLILLIAFIISISYSFYFQNKPVVDAKKYDEIGWNMAQGFGYKIIPDRNIKFDQAIYLVGPGYQFFLAIVFYLVGHKLTVIWLLQALMLVLSGYLGFLVSKEIFKEKWNTIIGITTAGLITLSPDLIMTSGMIFTDILGIFLMMCSIWTFLKFYNGESGSYLLLSSVSLALGAMTRSTLAILLPLFLFYLIKEKRWRETILMTGIVILIFTPWTIRNWKAYDMFIPFNTAGHIDFWWGNRVGATGELDDFPEISEAMNTYDVKTVSNLSIKNGKEFITSHPILFFKLLAKKASIYVSFIRPTGWWPFPGPRGYALDTTRTISLTLSGLYSVIIFTLGIGGMWKAFKDRKALGKERVWLLIIVTLLMPLSVIWLFVESRYRFPVYPLLAIFAGYFTYVLKQEKQWWKNKILWTVFTILTLNSIFDIAINFSRILERIG